MKIRAVSVPLITVDPYFSIWSPHDNLADGHTCHWTGRRNGMLGMVKVDGKVFRFMGNHIPADCVTYRCDVPALPQKSLDVTPTASVYTFENELLKLVVTFRTPLLLDDLVLMSRPVSYIEYEAKLKGDYSFELYFDIDAEACSDFEASRVKFSKTELSLCCGNVNQNPLNKSGDDHRIDWGYLHLARPDAFVSGRRNRFDFMKGNKVDKSVSEGEFYICDHRTLAVITEETKGLIPIAYDDTYSIQYFGENLRSYCYTKYASFVEMLKCAVADYEEVKEKCEIFDIRLTERMLAVGKDYAAVGCLAYRQAIAAHKLVDSKDGPLFLSKECFSNGCIATLDVTYPSIPLFLLFNPELVKGMLRPLVRYARSDAWKFPFAPHDCGQYPLCNGQVYGLKDGELKYEMQMPVEECANFILCVAAVCVAENSLSFADDTADLCKKWADYLVENGYDPENQLCTDDFAGHLAHNCNLSVKAIMALGVYSKLSGQGYYGEKAKEFALRWAEEASNDEATRLTFDNEDGWSLKYNMVWDRFFGLNLFPAELYNREIALYKNKMNEYGVPLDCRSDYTKLDWLTWTTVLTDNKAYSDAVFAAIRRMIEETDNRVPITDWYFTSTAKQRVFQNRTVLGGFFINLMLQ